MATVVKDLGAVTAYAYAVAGGYSGTEAEFEALLGNIAEDLSEIENLSVTVTTLPAGSSATASYSNGVLSLGIPKGDKGDKGNTGATGATGPTGNGISTITKTGTSGLVDTYTITFTNGDTTTFTVTNGEDGEVTTAQMNAAIETALEDYAKVDGSYTSLTAGNAEQLVSTVGVNDKTPYLFRTTGGSADVGDRVKLSEITGGTVAWNQLVNTGDTSVTVPNGHKYYSRINSVQTIGASTGAAISINDASKDNVFDLTAMFGSTIADYIYSLEQNTAGAGVAWFRKLFPKDYYAYDAGSLQSVNTSAHNMVGFNAWDEEWEVGSISEANGSNIGANDRIRSKNYIPVLPGSTYYFKMPTGVNARVFFYDANNTFIRLADIANATFTPQTGEYYIRFRTFVAYGTTYNHDICINLSWDGEKDGTYEPYELHSYALDSSLTLRGIPKLDSDNKLYYDGDTYESDGTVTRKYAVSQVLGTAISNNGSDNTKSLYKVFWRRPNGAYTLNVLCNKFVRGSVEYGMAVRTNSDGLEFIIPFSALNVTSADDDNTVKLTAAKTWLTNNATYVVYELATPTTESAEPYQETQVCNDFGTEEFVDSRTVPMPVGANALYQANLRAKLEMAPDSPDGDGDYIVRQTDGLNEYVAVSSNSTISGLSTRCPACPTDTDGTFVLKATVSSGAVTYAWTAES